MTKNELLIENERLCRALDGKRDANERLNFIVRDLKKRLKALSIEHALSWCNCDPDSGWRCRGHDIADLRSKNWTKR